MTLTTTLINKTNKFVSAKDKTWKKSQTAYKEQNLTEDELSNIYRKIFILKSSNYDGRAQELQLYAYSLTWEVVEKFIETSKEPGITAIKFMALIADEYIKIEDDFSPEEIDVLFQDFYGKDNGSIKSIIRAFLKNTKIPHNLGTKFSLSGNRIPAAKFLNSVYYLKIKK